MHTDTMEQAIAEVDRLLKAYYDGMYTLQEVGDAIYLTWVNCKERQQLTNAG